MVFNWFRRQFDKKSEETEAESQSSSEPSVAPEETETAPEPEPESEPEITSPEEPEIASEETEAAPSAADDYLKWAKAAYQNIQQQKTVAAPPEPEVEPEPEPEGEPEVETAPEPTPEPEETPAPTSFLERAEADRAERLERLEAEAIETAVEQEEVPEFAFDDDFMWSAEVLAAQGRRPEDVSAEEIAWLQKLRRGLNKTRIGLTNQLKAIVGQGPLNQDAVDEIEALLLQADVGIEATDAIVEALQNKLREETLPPEEAIAYLKQILREMLDKPFQNGYATEFVPDTDKLNIWLITGVNGAGKTTTIGKLAYMAKQSDYTCTIAAADTFRAAAVEQIKIWGDRSNTPVIANPGKNTDPAAVVFDAINAAKAKNVQLLLVDTAGRLQNKKNLMEELNKIRRIIDKKAAEATVESLLVLDATLGQNGLNQARVFSEAANLSGAILTKLDSSAKGGVALAVVRELGLPIRFIGAGEGIEDLRPFSSYEFVEALLEG